MQEPRIIAYSPDRRDAVEALMLAAWAPVFPRMQRAVPGFVYDAFYPEGWQARQLADLRAMLEDAAVSTWLLEGEAGLLGFVGLQIHPEDRMGAIHILAVAPEHQRKGHGARLMRFAEDRIRAAGMAMVMVETVGDPGHAPARAAYEAAGYQSWPVARYFKPLD